MHAVRTIVVGLGNPGADYAETRHNIGFRVVDALASSRGLRWRRFPWFRPLALAATDDRMILAKPRTFMNRSGLAARALCARHGIESAAVLAVSRRWPKRSKYSTSRALNDVSSSIINRRYCFFPVIII